MSLISRPPIGTAIARVLSAVSTRAPMPKREFADLTVETSEITVPTRHGAVACTVHRPPNPGATPPPVYVNLHGGGFVIRFRQQDDPWCRYLATHAGAVVVNVDYGTAPKHPFPVAAEQAFDVVRWAAEPDRDWDGTRLVVGGQSAGGNLTAAAARQALEAGGPAIALQVLHYPVLDLRTSPRDKPRPEGKGSVPDWLAEVFDTSYARDPAVAGHRLVSPAWGSNAEGIEGIAPALVVTAERDSLGAEGAAYARSLAAAGALVEHREVPDAGHGYDVQAENPQLTRELYAWITEHVRRATARDVDQHEG